MGTVFKIKPIINKSNNQININIPRKKLPAEFKLLMSKKPNTIKALKLKFEGWE